MITTAHDSRGDPFTSDDGEMTRLALSPWGEMVVGPHDYDFLAAWKYSSTGKHALRHDRSVPGSKIVHAHHEVVGRMGLVIPPGCEVDHINQDSFDNRPRVYTKSRNSHNRGLSSRNTSGVTGVSFSEAAYRWVAAITINRVVHRLGVFGLFEDAVAARLRAERRWLDRRPILLWAPGRGPRA